MNIEEVQAALAEKIDSMRRQTLTLDIPEYEDVKQTFQVLLNTIEERDRDIIVLQKHISQMAQSMADEQDKIELLNARVNMQEEKMKILEVGSNKVDVDVGVLIKESSRVHMSRVTSPGDQLGTVFVREDLETIEDSVNNSIVVYEPAEEPEEAAVETEFREDDYAKSMDLDESTRPQSPFPLIDGVSLAQLNDRIDALERHHHHSVEDTSKKLEDFRSEAERLSRSRTEALRDRLLSDMEALRSMIPATAPKEERIESPSPSTSIGLEPATEPPEFDAMLSSAANKSQPHGDSSTAISNEAVSRVVESVDSSSNTQINPSNTHSVDSQVTAASDTAMASQGIDEVKALALDTLDDLRLEMLVSLIRRDFDIIRSSLDAMDKDDQGDFSSFMSTYHALSGATQQLNSLSLALSHARLEGGKNNNVYKDMDALSNEIRVFADSAAKSLSVLLKSYDPSKPTAPLPPAKPAQETAAVAECWDKLNNLEAKFEALFMQQDTRLGQLETSRIDGEDIEYRILVAVKDRIPSRINDAVVRNYDFSSESLWKLVQPLVMKTVASEVDKVRAEMMCLKDIMRPASPISQEPIHMTSGISRKDTHDFDDETDLSNLMKEVKALRAEYRNMSAALSQMKLQVKKATEMAISKSAGAAGHDSTHDSPAANVTPMRRKSLQRSASLIGHSDFGDYAIEDRAHQISPSGRIAGAAGIPSGLGVTSSQSAGSADAELHLRLEQELARISSAVQGLTVGLKYLQ